jgi:tetratricopeptide (TPR) repeat protein
MSTRNLFPATARGCYVLLAVTLLCTPFLSQAADNKAVDALVAKASAIPDNRKAADVMTQAIAMAPDRAELYLLRSHYYDQGGQYDNALKDANKYIEMQPGDYEGFMNRAKVYNSDGKFDLAIADANKAVELAPTEPDVYYARSDIYRDSGKKTESAADEKKADALLKKQTGR